MGPDRPTDDEGIRDVYFFGRSHVRLPDFADPRFRDSPTELLGVLPMGRSQSSHGVTLMLLCLEVYRNGSIFQMRMVNDERDRSDIPAPFIRRLQLDITDDLGTIYKMVSEPVWSVEHEARIAYRLWPAIDQCVRAIVVASAVIDYVDPETGNALPERITYDTSAWRFPFILVGNQD